MRSFLIRGGIAVLLVFLLWRFEQGYYEADG
jgi:hypothetical protein